MSYQEYTTQMLVVGGAIAGLSAALTAKRISPELDILIADKSDASYGFSGKSSRTAGLLSFVTHEDDPEAFVKYCVENVGFYLNDQDLLRQFANASDTVLRSLKEWGVDVPEDEHGYADYLKWPFPWGTASIDPDMCVSMAQKAKEQGVRYLERVVIFRLLKEGDAVTGAVGFSLITGELIVIRANAVVLACGSQNYDITKSWCATGNAILMAYEAGAEMRNCEFGNMCDFARTDPSGIVLYAAAHTAHDHLYVGEENISQKYRPGMHSSMDPMAAYAWYKETVAGRLVEADVGEFEQTEGRNYFKKHEKAVFRAKRTFANQPLPQATRFPVVPGFIGELSCIRVNHRMQATVKGLYAVGDTSGGGTARAGAVATPPGKIHGTGIYNAVFTGIWGGRAACAEAGRAPAPAGGGVDSAQVERIARETFAPLNRSQDGIFVRDMIHDVQDIIMPTDYSLVKSEARMRKALDRLDGLKEKLDQVYVRDLHELAKYVDLRSMLLGAELFYRASMERKESRGFHIREDYPYMDNRNWLKWVVVRKGEAGPELSTVDIPIQDYDYKPAEERTAVIPEL